jgi:carbamoyltransferase
MLVLGISGGVNLIHENHYPVNKGFFHDAAAALIDNGRIAAAIEEERLNRIKHTNKAPAFAIRFCLDSRGLCLNDLDKIAFYGTENQFNQFLKQTQLHNPRSESISARDLLHRVIRHGCETDIDDSKIVFVHHHLAHATSAYALSGFDKSLILTIDGQGDGIAGMVLEAHGTELTRIHSIPASKSLGWFYDDVIRFIGYDEFEEYKVMGLAPYGNPANYRRLFKSFYTLMPQGEYILHKDRLGALYEITQPRRKKDPIMQAHQDIAASLQDALEEIVLHVLAHYREKTGQANLCLAGGVAHNCSLNGKILYSKMFSDIFVQPAAHDAGCAIGAALHVYLQSDPTFRPSRLEHVYLGTDVRGSGTVAQTLSDWGAFIEYEKVENVSSQAARLIADGAIIGWVQGRSEFGPRALGNRSILADPRPAENKEIINAMVKKREAYRPFAPSVLEEYVHDFFDLPPDKNQLPYMVFVVRVLKEKQHLLGAVTHVDGTARVHTVSKAVNRRFWDIINEFGQLTGVHMLLNTSFNNNVEPIVDSAEDAIVCFLTTQLHYLIIDDYVIRRRECGSMTYMNMVPSLPLYARMNQTKQYISANEMKAFFEIGNSYDNQYKVTVTPEVFGILSGADGNRSLDELMKSSGLSDDKSQSIITEILDLWSKRIVRLKPRKQ